MWVNEYLIEVYGETHGQDIIADIDHRYVIFSAWLYLNLHIVC